MRRARAIFRISFRKKLPRLLAQPDDVEWQIRDEHAEPRTAKSLFERFGVERLQRVLLWKKKENICERARKEKQRCYIPYHCNE